MLQVDADFQTQGHRVVLATHDTVLRPLQNPGKIKNNQICESPQLFHTHMVLTFNTAGVGFEKTLIYPTRATDHLKTAPCKLKQKTSRLLLQPPGRW